MRRIILTINLLLVIYTNTFSQHLLYLLLSVENNLFVNCKCTVTIMGNEYKKITYVKDTLNKIITTQFKNKFGTEADTFYFDNNDKIIEIRSYIIGEDSSHLDKHYYYSYSKKGQLLTANEGFYIYSYQYDDKGRPLSYTRKYENKQDDIKIKYSNDTTALLEYFNNGIKIAKGKRILNKRFQIVRETLQNLSKGTEVHYAFKYDKNGNMLYMEKSKDINDEVRFFGSPHYDYLIAGLQKIEYTYDHVGRMLTHTLYSVNLGKFFLVRYNYK